MPQPSAALPVHMSANSGHAAGAAPKTPAQSGDAFGKYVYHPSSGQVNNYPDEGFKPGHAPMMALSRHDVKTGKPG